TWAAAVIGIIAGVLVIESIWIIERKFKIDDPVGAISVHGVCGIFGVLSVGIFADGKYGAGWNATGNAIAEPVSTGVSGIIKGDWGQFAAQAIGALVICTVMFAIAFAFFKIQDTLTKGGIRSEEADEIAGLDLPEMGVPAYPEFMPGGDVVDVTGTGKDPAEEREFVASTASAPGAAGPADGSALVAGDLRRDLGGDT
ncbi:MAG: ammonium transporter, partial [Actinobacteria bacterium]|nr:ammonium transporter [Actinomycetota bacterium]